MLAALLGFTGVAFGAFGAHAVKGVVEPLADGAVRLGWWETAARYHLIHALAVGLAAVLNGQVINQFGRWAAIFFTVGIVLFSGSLYAMTFTGTRALGAITPLGGAAFLAGWIAIGFGARGLGRRREAPRPGEP